MVSRKSRKNVKTAAHSESEDEVEQRSSHDQNTVDMLKTAQNMVSSVSVTYPKSWRLLLC